MKTGGLFLTNKKLAETAAAAALALVLGYVETLIPLNLPIPGVKIGLSNLAVLFALYRVNKKSALAVTCIKVIVSALLFSGVQSIIYSAAGGFLSLFVMCLLKNILSLKYVSIAGGICHNIGQLAAAIAVLKSLAAVWYLPYLILGGAVTGALIGIVCELILKNLRRYI